MHYIGRVNAMTDCTIIQNNETTVEFHTHRTTDDVFSVWHLNAHT
jgi:hypothetical protein